MNQSRAASPHAGAGETSRGVFDGFVERSWRTNAERQRRKGVEFVIGKREKAYLWNIEGSKRVIDCGTAGGVHSLGHRHPEVVAALKRAIDEGRDTGLWALPNAPYLALQDQLARLAPCPGLSRSVITHCSTLSVDVAAMFAFRITGRRKLLAFRHGYHGHSGFAAMVTGSLEEGVLDYFNLPPEHSGFISEYGDLGALESQMAGDVAAVIIEPMDYETFAPATAAYLKGVSLLCRKHGALFILDETRTGLGRSGKLWAAEHFGVEPDMLITGKGLSGGLYPVSALLTTREIYDRCINEHQFAYISSLGGNEIASLVASKVLELSSDPALLAHATRVSGWLRDMLNRVCSKHGDFFRPGTVFGCIATIGLVQPELAADLYRNAFNEGVLCHSVSLVSPAVLKILPPLVIDEDVVAEIGEGLERAAALTKKRG